MSESAMSATLLRLDRFEDWPESTRELAFEIFMTDAGRNIRALRTILLDGTYGDPVDIPDRTLRHWKHVHQWDIEADARSAAYTPNIHTRIGGFVMVAALHGSSYLVRVNAGVEPPTRDRLVAAQIALNAAGYGSYSRRDTASRRALPPDTEDSASSPEDAARRIAERRARFGSKV